MNRFRLIRTSITALLALIVVPGSISARQQSKDKSPTQQDQAVKLKTNLIQLRAVVTDKKGKIIDNLTKEDFEVVDNGAPQVIDFFSVERVSGGSGTLPPAPNAPPTSAASASAPGRILVLFVDALHLSLFSLTQAKQQLKEFIDKEVTGRDVAAVVSTGSSLGVLQQFMKDKKMLKYAIDKISLRPPDNTSFTPYLAAQVLAEDPSAINVALSVLHAEEGYQRFNPASDKAYAQSRARQILDYETNLRRVTLQTLEGVSKRLADMPGQRMIAFISDGFTLLDDGAHQDDQDLNAVTSSAARSGVIIYSFYGKGLEAPAEFSAANRVSSVDFSRYMADSTLDDQSTMRTLAAETGGEAYINNNYIGSSLKKMIEQNSLYYAIAYYEPDTKNSKKMRKVAIRVKGHPEFEVRSQKRYLPFEEKKEEVAVSPEQKLFQDMILPLPLTSIGVTSECDFIEVSSDPSQATLQVHIDGSSLHYPRQGETYLFDCDLALAIFDSSGKLASSSSHTIKSSLTSGQVELGKRRGYRYSERLNLKPGLYQVRVGVREADTGLTGTSTSWVRVPDLHNGKLALSNVFLGKTSEDSSRGGGEAPKSAGKPEVTAGNAKYKVGELAQYQFVVYNAANAAAMSSAASGANTANPGHADSGPVLKVEILQGEKSIYSTTEPLASRTIALDAKGIVAGGALKLGLAPGVYTLRITVKDSKTKKPVEQTVDFEVEA